MCGADKMDQQVKLCLWVETDLVNHSHINLQYVRNMHCGCGRCLECQTKVMNHQLHLPWVDRRNLGTHTSNQSDVFSNSMDFLKII